MRTQLTLFALNLALGTAVLLAQDKDLGLPGWPPTLTTNGAATSRALPLRQISAGDIEQDSIQMFALHTNYFVVRWAYTEAGAKKMLV